MLNRRLVRFYLEDSAIRCVCLCRSFKCHPPLHCKQHRPLIPVMSDDGDGDARLELFKEFAEKYYIDLEDPVDTVQEFEEVEELDLSEKDLTKLPSDLGQVLPPNLKTLALEKNQLTNLPDSIGDFHHITELYVRENHLESLPDGIRGLGQIESLYLEDNKLTADGIPESIAELAETMTGLCLHRNLLTTLPVSICQLTNLEELYLNENAIESLPEELGQLVNLRELDILGNKLQTLPTSFRNLSNLEILHAENNQLVKLPKGMGGLTSLKKVYLQNNKLIKLHSSLGRCVKLEVLNVEDNCLQKVAKRIGELPKLKHLLLANNQIMELPFNPLEKAPGLRRLTLSGNALPVEILALEQKVTLNQVAEGEEEE